MSKHTPGPWTFGLDFTYAVEVKSSDGDLIAEAMAVLSEEETKANMRLIAAAPELLEQLEKAHDLLSMWHVGVDGVVTDDLLQIRAAIDKARGEA